MAFEGRKLLAFCRLAEHTAAILFAKAKSVRFELNGAADLIGSTGSQEVFIFVVHDQRKPQQVRKLVENPLPLFKFLRFSGCSSV